MLNKKVKILLVGIGGYGETYAKEVIENINNKIELVGIVDPMAEKSSCYTTFKEKNIPIFKDLDLFYENNSAELAVISSPIQFHKPQIITALENNSNVLCEKPLCATIEEAEAIVKAEENSSKFVAIGYQWSFSKAMQDLKQDYISGKLGKAIRLKTLVCWPRDTSYYSRNEWAGKVKNRKGDWILDSPVSNATAHYLHNMLYVIGKTINESVVPKTIQAETYKAKPIENFDTATIRCVLEDDTEILFYTTHAVQIDIGPLVCYEFENATVYYQGSGREDFIAKFNDGTTKNYGNPNANRMNKFWSCVNAVQNNTQIPCHAKTAMSHTICVNEIRKNKIIEVADEEKSTLNIGENKLTIINDIIPTFIQCYTMNKLPSELKK